MEVIIFIIIVIAALLTIASGVWVAIALVNAISAGSRGAGSLHQGRQDSQDRRQRPEF